MESITIRKARYSFTAQRDEAGVPHVKAEDWRAAIYALGYLHALDRPTQIYFARCIAAGRAAERIAAKPELVEMDTFLRRANLGKNLDDEVAALEPRILEQLLWYCEGVNDGLADGKRSLPMWVAGFDPHPWEPSAILLLGNLLSFAGLAVGEQEAEQTLLELIQLGVEDERIRELFAPYLDGIDFAPLRDIHITKRLSDEALELLADLPRLAGSNAWAVSPARSATGSALLASDPHLEVNRLPAIWYEAVLNWSTDAGESRYAMGATLPGCPLMAVGRTQDLSWGVTYMAADTSDFFIEDCRPGGATGWQYRRDEVWHDFELRREQIGRKGQEPLEIEILENDLATLTRTPEQPGSYMSVAWIGSHVGSGRAVATWLDLFSMPSAKAAMEHVRESPHPSLVWVFADREGHIGLQASGWLPQRAPHASGITPLAAWDVSNHWRGVVPAHLLPHAYDPPIGFVATANEEQYRIDGPPLHASHLSDYRLRRIVELLTAMPKATIADMQSIQYDVLSTHARDLLPVLLAHVDDCPLKQRLLAWDCRYNPESTDASLFNSFYRHILLEIFGQEAGIGWRRMLYLSTRMGYSKFLLTACDRALRKVTSSWWRNRDKGEMIRRAAERAQSEPDRPWSKVNEFHFVNRFINLGSVGRLLGLKSPPIAMPGCHATPFQGHLLTTKTRESTFAPSYHFVTDMGTDLAWTNLPGGPSESAFSWWYQSDLQRWQTGEYKCLSVDGDCKDDAEDADLLG
ncbi:penicillin acylase family protein [Aeoliella sp. SH292]|uniref:penicillin acylase family protein n=1 Tax=Aeoliella sp. SH292 TaxID=3454464 RepID=UPI003F96948C